MDVTIGQPNDADRCLVLGSELQAAVAIYFQAGTEIELCPLKDTKELNWPLLLMLTDPIPQHHHRQLRIQYDDDQHGTEADEMSMRSPQHELSMGSKDRGFHQDPKATYMLPNDSPEHARLERQARLLSAIMDHKVIHSPLSPERVERVLDIGCGTGVVTKLLAEQFPKAQAFGVDLSEVPEVRQFPSNVHFLQGNILTQIPAEWKPVRGGKTLPGDDGLFDLCFSRLFINQLPDPAGLVKQEFRLLKPGGYIEMHELSGPMVDQNADPISDLGWWLEWTAAFEATTGATFRNTGKAAAAWMEAAGFVDIEVKEYMWPVGLHGASHAVRDQFGDVPAGSFEQDILDVYSTFVHRLHDQEVLDQESANRILEGLRKCVLSEKKHYHRFLVTVGRRPE
ncbi:Putative S-adenosyl-L-methionine-dependent methyltransferase [Septoria linicola]|uniref:S-adenosyl-L-methionine-dependent methyltransferase n=1 Tax=Septoria linicola TaxID=215465 RepID=A0A9Q9ARD6_9PEZI|nr:putative S-adenosyl-L-methionine-dependent methyltransferase [Septoria linicola]USW50788.1 Putative S-adenosyl-L-methionine-dependent methyltransferase [Septoria linicola]